MNRLVLVLMATAYIASAFSGGAIAQERCSAADFGGVVDQTAQALRDLNISGSKRFRAKLDAARDQHGLSEEEIQRRATAVQDAKIDEFNKEIDTLVSRMDVLSQTPNDKIDCAKLEELKRIRDQLLTVMGQKSGYMLARIDVELGKPAGPPVAATSPNRTAKGNLVTQPPAATDRTATANDAAPPVEAQAAAAAPAPAPALSPDLPQKRPANIPEDRVRTARIDPANTNDASPPPAYNDAPDQPTDPSQGGNTTQPAPAYQSDTAARPDEGLPPPDTAYARAPDEQPLSPPTSLAPPPDGALPPPSDRDLALPPDGYQQLPPPVEESDDSYSIDEIREAGRGIFGTITAEFAGAINYAFQQFGHPNAYIVGGEGGGAILAGLRYGSGTLHRKGVPPSDIFWQGPSLGYDLGAEGSRAIFLVYNLNDPNNIYGRFTGIGGSAYVAGGIGLNILGKGSMVMVPIRSGIGLRLGANVAYLKFTDRQTWNPF